MNYLGMDRCCTARFMLGCSWILHKLKIRYESQSWSYDSWIYNYLYTQFLSPLMLWVRIPIRARCTTLC